MKLRALVAALSAASLLVACGGGGSSAGTSPFGSGSGAGTGASSPTTGSGGTSNAQALALSVQLLDGSGQSTTSLAAGSTLRVKAALTQSGVALKDQLVQFSLEQLGEYGVLDQLTALTDGNGVAVVNLGAGTQTGAGRVKVIAKLADGTEVSGGANFIASATGQTTTTLTLANFAVDTSPVSAYGTTGFSVKVLNNGAPYTTPVTVSFSSDCAATKAVLTSSAQTRPDGIAVGTFEDKGCATSTIRPVVLTASIGTGTAQTQFQLQPSSAGSLRFVTVSPSDASITLQGQGGVGRQENAQLTFKLVDQAGNGVPNADVCFDSSTYVGGLTIDGYNNAKLPATQGSAALCGSDALSVVKYVKRTNASGDVTVQVASGTVPTPVRVRARALYPDTAITPLTTFSDALSISTGLPLQRSFSLSVNKANIDGGNGTAGGSFDGEKAVLTVRLADQFSNPVPDGTKVSFIASGGAVCTSQNGSCSTVNGTCSCDFVTQARRPQDGRVVVLAYADGLEDYDDTNGNNIYDDGESFGDLADAFVDANKSGGYSGVNINGDLDIPVPYQSPANYTSGNGKRGNAHIRASTILYLSAPSSTGNPTVVIPNTSLSRTTDLLVSGAPVAQRFVRLDSLLACPVTTPQTDIELYLDDGYGNPMAAGTTLVTSNFSDNLVQKSFKPSSVLALGGRAPSAFIDGGSNGNGGNVIKVLPWSSTGTLGNVTTRHVVTVSGVANKCEGTASFVLDAASPRGAAKSVSVLYEGESRAAAHGFDVRYLDQLAFALDSVSASVNTDVTLSSATFNVPVGITAQSYRINWGDGANVGPIATFPIANTSHRYTAAGSYTVTLRVTGSDGVERTATRNITITP